MSDVSSAQYIYYKTSMLCHEDVNKRLLSMRKILSDLQEKTKKDVLEDTSFWQEELKKIKEESEKTWREKVDRLEARLASQEEELQRLQQDNEVLQKQLEVPYLCKSDGLQNGFGRIDSAFEDDEEETQQHKPLPPAEMACCRKYCENLQEKLSEGEQRVNQLSQLLDQKVIENNKLQITLSKQTKEIIELEKSYVQLQCRMRKNTSKPIVTRLCSKDSPFSPKNLRSLPTNPPPNNVSS